MSKARDIADLLDSAGKVTADDLDVGAIGGRRNLIINGAMQVAQRGTSATGVSTGSYNTCDRWKQQESSLGTWTLTREADGPTGFSHSYKMECTTADTSPDASNYVRVEQRIEGQNLQCLGYGTTEAKTMTMSFWVKSNKTGTYQAWFYSPDGDRHVTKTYSIDSADTWEYKTVTVPADTSGTINPSSGLGLYASFALGAGSAYSSGTSPTEWESMTSANRHASLGVNLADTVGNYFQFTGVQLELGKVATPFEHRSYGEELALCQRYYFVSGNIDCGQSGAAVSGGYSTYYAHSWTLPVTMRTTPTIRQNITVTTNSAGVQSALVTPTTYSYNHGNMTGNYSYWDGQFILDAEL